MQYSLTKCASLITRGSNIFYDRALAPYGIGAGQQFFLCRIAENEGISMNDLACLGTFDKGTVTRAMQKLYDGGYITCVVDEKDRRIRRLYITEAARPLLDRLYALRLEWESILTSGLSAEEAALAGKLLEKLALNAADYRAAFCKKEGENGHG